MATIRETIHIDAPPDKVWAEVRDPLAVTKFFDALGSVEMVGNAREIKMGDITIVEEIVTVDEPTISGATAAMKQYFENS
jgi:carbon monoxide dehydrogenase subunit G